MSPEGVGFVVIHIMASRDALARGSFSLPFPIRGAMIGIAGGGGAGSAATEGGDGQVTLRQGVDLPANSTVSYVVGTGGELSCDFGRRGLGLPGTGAPSAVALRSATGTEVRVYADGGGSGSGAVIKHVPAPLWMSGEQCLVDDAQCYSSVQSIAPGGLLDSDPDSTGTPGEPGRFSIAIPVDQIPGYYAFSRNVLGRPYVYEWYTGPGEIFVPNSALGADVEVLLVDGGYNGSTAAGGAAGHVRRCRMSNTQAYIHVQPAGPEQRSYVRSVVNSQPNAPGSACTSMLRLPIAATVRGFFGQSFGAGVEVEDALGKSLNTVFGCRGAKISVRPADEPGQAHCAALDNRGGIVSADGLPGMRGLGQGGGMGDTAFAPDARGGLGGSGSVFLRYPRSAWSGASVTGAKIERDLLSDKLSFIAGFYDVDQAPSVLGETLQQLDDRQDRIRSLQRIRLEDEVLLPRTPPTQLLNLCEAWRAFGEGAGPWTWSNTSAGVPLFVVAALDPHVGGQTLGCAQTEMRSKPRVPRMVALPGQVPEAANVAANVVTNIFQANAAAAAHSRDPESGGIIPDIAANVAGMSSQEAMTAYQGIKAVLHACSMGLWCKVDEKARWVPLTPGTITDFPTILIVSTAAFHVAAMGLGMWLGAPYAWNQNYAIWFRVITTISPNIVSVRSIFTGAFDRHYAFLLSALMATPLIFVGAGMPDFGKFPEKLTFDQAAVIVKSSLYLAVGSMGFNELWVQIARINRGKNPGFDGRQAGKMQDGGNRIPVTTPSGVVVNIGLGTCSSFFFVSDPAPYGLDVEIEDDSSRKYQNQGVFSPGAVVPMNAAPLVQGTSRSFVIPHAAVLDAIQGVDVPRTANITRITVRPRFICKARGDTRERVNEYYESSGTLGVVDLGIRNRTMDFIVRKGVGASLEVNPTVFWHDSILNSCSNSATWCQM